MASGQLSISVKDVPQVRAVLKAAGIVVKQHRRGSVSALALDGLELAIDGLVRESDG